MSQRKTLLKSGAHVALECRFNDGFAASAGQGNSGKGSAAKRSAGLRQRCAPTQ